MCSYLCKHSTRLLDCLKKTFHVSLVSQVNTFDGKKVRPFFSLIKFCLTYATSLFIMLLSHFLRFFYDHKIDIPKLFHIYTNLLI